MRRASPRLAGVSDVASRARVMNELGRGEQALALIGPALAQDPDDVELLVQAAIALIDLDREAEALGFLHAAAAHQPDSPVVHKLLSLARRGAGDPVGAYHAGVRATQLVPDDANAHIQVAYSAAALGDQANARTAGQNALRLAPDDPGSHLAMAMALFPEGTKQPAERLKEAEQHVRRALELRPGNPGALNELARIQLQRGRLFSAAGHLSDSVRGAPSEAVIQRNMDIVLVGLIRWCHWILFAAWFVGGRLTTATGTTLPRWALVGVGLMGAAAVAVIAWQLRTRVPADMRAGFLRGFWRRQKLGALWGLCLALTCLLFLVAAVLPVRTAQLVFFSGGGPLVVGVVLSWVRVARQ